MRSGIILQMCQDISTFHEDNHDDKLANSRMWQCNHSSLYVLSFVMVCRRGKKNMFPLSADERPTIVEYLDRFCEIYSESAEHLSVTVGNVDTICV